ncbi:hypothetical protein WT44_17855 [Burkholderia stagnalis]|uniref:Uncharacterized protein n=1 Tax=Burkholderia stagnalis TaxID=1503054 RepID=A0A106P4U6_9BURK|nr:hypothetical protein WT05_10970 [Burkholderia stagnalis]KWA61244.1 hypothetical protein WT44_17855 [Burkholderia stagnalis]
MPPCDGARRRCAAWVQRRCGAAGGSRPDVVIAFIAFIAALLRGQRGHAREPASRSSWRDAA